MDGAVPQVITVAHGATVRPHLPMGLVAMEWLAMVSVHLRRQ